MVLLPEKKELFRKTGHLGLMIVPPHQRDTQLLSVFDPINNTNHEAIKVDRWEPVRDGSHLCRPVGLELRMIDEIKVPESLWGLVNKAITGSPIQNCAAVNFCVQGHPWNDMVDTDLNPDAYARVLEQAIQQIAWEQDDPQYRSDRHFCENLHLMDGTTKMDYIGGGVKTFSVKVPWKA